MRVAAQRRVERGTLRVWDDDGPVALAGFGTPNASAPTARIAPVYTPPLLRGRGYGSALVASLCRELFGAGKRAIYLTTDVANPTSNGIYRSIGFRPTADHFHFDLVPLAS
jgi:predicted GNAT family acetyltransferase